MDARCACCFPPYYRRENTFSRKGYSSSFSDDCPVFRKETDCWSKGPRFILKPQLSRCRDSSISSCYLRKFALSSYQRTAASHLRRHAAAPDGFPFCVPCWSVGRHQHGRGVLFSRRVLLGFITQHSEGSWPLIQDDSTEQKARENATLLSSSSSSPSSSSSSSSGLSALSSQSFSAITDESFNETRRLVETAMLAAAAGLAYFLSNTFKIENYFGCFFPLPLVISSLRWGITAGRKTMVATGMLLLVLSGPLKAATYLLMHGFLGLMMGALWRSKVSWGTSIMICTLVRSIGAMGFVFLTSWLIRENLLVLITINAHASISLLLAAMGINFVPSMEIIYFIFGTLVLLNCGTFVFILHLLYAIFLKRLELNTSVVLPAWLKAL